MIFFKLNLKKKHTVCHCRLGFYLLGFENSERYLFYGLIKIEEIIQTIFNLRICGELNNLKLLKTTIAAAAMKVIATVVVTRH